MTLLDLSRAGVSTPSLSDRTRVATRLRAAVWSRRTFLVASLCLVAVAALAFTRWQVAGAVVPWDSKNQFYPFFRFLGGALRDGTLPLWNPHQFGGYPVAADPQSLLFTPTMLLFALVAPNASMPVFDAVIMAHLAVGGIGVLGLARRWRWHPQAGVLAGLVFMLGGVAASRLQHTGMIISYSFFPLALWSLQAALDSRSLRVALVAGLMTTLMALGRDQVAFLLCMALVGAVARQAFRSGAIVAYLASRAGVIATAFGLTLALMIVPILLTLQFLHVSNRPGIAFGRALEGSLDPINLVTLLAPNLFGSLDKVYDYWGPGVGAVTGTDWTDRSIDYLFAGTLPAVLLLWHGLVGGRLLERGARYFALVLVAATVYALGRHTLLFSFIFDWLPGVSMYRRPADASFLVNVALAFCAGYLLHRFIEEGLPRLRAPRPLAWGAIATIVATVAALAGSALVLARAAGRLDGALVQLAVAAGAAVLVVAALVGFRRRLRRPLVATLLVAATAAQLLWVNAASPLNAEPSSTYSAYAKPWPDQARGLAVLQAELARRHADGARPRVEFLGVYGAWQNAGMLYGWEDTLGYNPLRIDDYARAVGADEDSWFSDLRRYPDTFRGYNSRLASLLGLEYLVLRQPIADMPRNFPRPRATLLFSGDCFYLYRLDTAPVPRATLATHLVPVDGARVLETDNLPQFALGREALIEASDAARLGDKALLAPETATPIPPPATPGDAPAASGAVRIVTYTDNAVTLTVDAPAPGVVVLHDIAYPGWTARVDGVAKPVLRADLLFRVVEVPAGHHVVEFAFHPFSPANLTAAAASVAHPAR